MEPDSKENILGCRTLCITKDVNRDMEELPVKVPAAIHLCLNALHSPPISSG